MAGSTDWFRESFRTEYDKQNAALGRFNLAIFGKTGVGKSTLINAIFGEEVARTGIGEPVTKGSHLYLDKIGHLGIVDTQGARGRQGRQGDPVRPAQGHVADAQAAAVASRSTWPGSASAGWTGGSRRPRPTSSAGSTRWACR